jgi:4-hydroxybenzoate polyprenyltransferase
MMVRQGSQMDAPGLQTPLAVDMDGTLLKTDVFFESLASALFKKPFSTMALLPTALFGRAPLKRAMAVLGPLDIDSLPARQDLIVFLQGERAAGRPVHLVTAADTELAEKVAARFGLFERVYGSSGNRNLKGRHKRALLEEEFPDGYAYAGDSPADITVWQGAKSVVLAGANKDTSRRAEDLGLPVEQKFEQDPAGLRAWLKALRLHQWMKNLLVFVPLLLAQAYTEPPAVLATLLAFLCLGLAASGSYVLNDLADLAADRAHRTKKNRPFASGRLKVAHGLVVGPGLVALGLLGSLFVNLAFAFALAVYIVITLSYSLRLKRVALLDTTVLAGLFTLRLGMGAAAAAVAFTPWLFTFSMFFFLSLSLAKRHVEILGKRADGATGMLPGRGYLVDDWPLTLGLGLSAAVASSLILVLYLVEDAFPQGLYAHPSLLWATPLLVGLWLMRVWLLASRGQLDDDPVAFAIKDPLSLILGACVGACFVGASVAFAPITSTLMR